MHNVSSLEAIITHGNDFTSCSSSTSTNTESVKIAPSACNRFKTFYICLLFSFHARLIQDVCQILAPLGIFMSVITKAFGDIQHRLVRKGTMYK